MSLAQEFKEFISRGNVVDLAVGVIIGGAFGSIVTSLVKDVVMPPIGYLMSGIDFSSMKYTIPHSTPPVDISYGKFITTLIQFFIVALVIFLVVKGVNSLKRQEAAKPSDPPVPSAEEKLLIEIRDLLAKR